MQVCTGATRRWYAAAAPSDGTASCTCSSTPPREDTFTELASNAQLSIKSSLVSRAPLQHTAFHKRSSMADRA